MDMIETLSQHFSSPAELSRRTGLSRWTASRLLSGETRRLQKKTLRKLEDAGIISQRVIPLVVPPNVRVFALVSSLSFAEVDALVRTRLATVDTMEAAELQHVLESARRFPKLYGWPQSAERSE